MPKVAHSVPVEEAVSPTGDHLLDVAETLFARHGFSGATLRRITERAGVNLAAVHYHFGGKEALYRAVFVRRIRPMNLARIEMLSAAEAIDGKGASIPLHTLLEILIRPITTLIDSTSPEVHPFARVMARTLVEPEPFMEKAVAEEFRPLLDRFVPHLLRHLPHLDQATLLWRARFLIGAATVTFGRMNLVERRLRALGAPTDGGTILRQFVAFAEAGLSTPSPSPS